MMFLDSSSHLYKRVCPSLGQSVGPYVCNAFVKNARNGEFYVQKWSRRQKKSWITSIIMIIMIIMIIHKSSPPKEHNSRVEVFLLLIALSVASTWPLSVFRHECYHHFPPPPPPPLLLQPPVHTHLCSAMFASLRVGPSSSSSSPQRHAFLEASSALRRRSRRLLLVCSYEKNGSKPIWIKAI